MATFRPGPGLDERVAARWAVPEAHRLADLLAERVRANAPAARTWITKQDERVRKTHVEADGQTIPTNLRFILSHPSSVQTSTAAADRQGSSAPAQGGGQELARVPRDPQLSIGNRINCFPWWVHVEAVGLRASIKARYSGPMVSLRTASGRIFAGTPNHPVLTDRGWIALGKLKVGDHLVHASRSDLCEAGDLPVEPDVEHGPAPIGEVHRALAQAGLAHRVPGGAVDLYGDPVDGEVEVVAADRQLLVNEEPAGPQGVGEFLFALADLAHLRPGLGLHLLLRGARASACGIGRLSKRLSLLRRRRGHALPHRGGPVARLHAGRQQQSADREAADAMRTSERLLGLPGGVATDELVHVDVRDWSGHVYTLSTDIGAYTVAGGIVVANCRCVAAGLPGAIAQHVAAGDVHLRAAQATATVSVTFDRIVESEHPGPEDGGGGWLARAVAEARGQVAG